ncbi:hypothetical protein Bbelb_371890 [Branchiostoma belcheri]|nr:hypothetical protein Bbelb_371890 [Branchiostoma belcheri]
MWKHLIFTAAILASSQGQEFLTIMDGWEFFKLPSRGVMSNTNVKATCEAAGMSYPCYDVSESCDHGRHWADGCITFNGGQLSCHTPTVLSLALCGHTIPRLCHHLDDTFVYNPHGWGGDSAYGTDYDTGSNLFGSFHHDMLALCAVDPSSAPVTDVPKVTDVTDLTDITDAPSVIDVTSVTDVPDATSVTDVPKVTDGTDVPKVTDVTDGNDVTDGPDVPSVTDGTNINDVITG